MRKFLIVLLIFIEYRADAKHVKGAVYDLKGNGLPGVEVSIKGSNRPGVFTDANGFYSISVKDHSVLVFSLKGYETREVETRGRKLIDVVLKDKAVIEAKEAEFGIESIARPSKKQNKMNGMHTKTMNARLNTRAMVMYEQGPQYNTEDYATIHESGFRKALDKPLSTFSADVDAASYSNIRRFIHNGQLPPKDAVRIEEMINYFGYEYKDPDGARPFSVNTEVSRAPWNEEHLIVQVGLQGRKIKMDDLPASNIVFLIDVSGSMMAPNKLLLLKSAFKLLVNELRPQDKVSIVVYAGAAGLALPPTAGDDKKTVIEALDQLRAGGPTAGGEGINLAYRTAKEHFVKGGNNRVVLATDGDFNIGASGDAAMERLIEEKRKEGVFLTVLGFGMGNYKDAKMEILADRGNGNYAYIDTMKEAKKVLVNEFGGTFFTIAKDVKIQVEFNPATVQAYRLIGYENRKLNDEDFNDDKKDAGELGSGHTVTALYEIIP